MTFSKGGATDFARAFFRVTEGSHIFYFFVILQGFPPSHVFNIHACTGRLVTEPEQQRHQSSGPSPDQDKKNK